MLFWVILLAGVVGGLLGLLLASVVITVCECITDWVHERSWP